MKPGYLIILFTFFLPFLLQAQEKYSLNGFIKDANTGEELIGATIFVEELGTGAVTNDYGFYSITLKSGDYTVRFSYIGFEPQVKVMGFETDRVLDIELVPSMATLEEVVITSKQGDENIKSAEMGVVKMDIKELETIPVLFGEKDILKSIQLLPGVSTAGEGSTGFYVRGGNTDQNLILLDEAPVYNASHLLGFFSVFNSDALKDIKLYKSGIPARYGGRLSSVLDVHMNNGNSKELAVTGGLGLISSRLTVEAPIKKDEGSFILSGRRTYADVIYSIAEPEFRGNSLFFYDFNAKANYRISKKDRLYVSGYFGRDKFGFGDFGFNWGNVTGTLRLNHVFNERLFSNTSLIYSNYDYQITADVSGTSLEILSGIEDIHFMQDFSYYLNAENTFRFGINVIHHGFKPGERRSEGENATFDIILEQQKAYESGLYLSNEQKAGSRINLVYGIRYSLFNVIGPGTVYTFDNEGNILDSKVYNKGEGIINYTNLEPRISGSFIINEVSSVKVSFHRMAQYIHLLSASTSDNPTDVWVPSSTIVKPETSEQYALGYFRNFSDNLFEASAEVYYKNMHNMVDYKDGADVLLNQFVEAELAFGKGMSYGLELFIKKRTGKFTGWVGYTLSSTKLRIDGVNNNAWYSARQDRRHDVSIVASYKLSRRWSLSANWIYYTGDAVTFPSGQYYIDGHVVPLYTERNGYRMPDYHRLDFSATLLGKQTRKIKSSWNFSVYNVYARENAYSISFQKSETNPATNEAVRLALFSIIPSVTWNFKF